MECKVEVIVLEVFNEEVSLVFFFYFDFNFYGFELVGYYFICLELVVIICIGDKFEFEWFVVVFFYFIVVGVFDISFIEEFYCFGNIIVFLFVLIDEIVDINFIVLFFEEIGVEGNFFLEGCLLDFG